MLYSHEQLYIHICMQKHIQHNKDERTQFFRKIYLSLYWKGGVWDGVGDGTKTATYWPQTLLAITVFLSCSGLLNWRSGGPSFCCDVVLIPASSLQLIWTSCHRGYIIIWPPPTSCERHNSHTIQPLDSQGRPLISSTGCTCYLHRCFSSLHSLAGVNM